jgi:hypothetical protein
MGNVRQIQPNRNRMNYSMEKLIEMKKQQYQENGLLKFTSEELNNLSPRDISNIKEFFHGYALMMLPDKEITFFEWLKINDPDVWDDLWSGEETVYIVSIDLIEHFLHSGNGFPICDLVTESNYWFTLRMIKPKGRELFPLIENKLAHGQKLSFEEALLLEIMRGPIDIWHFCYRYKIPVVFAKKKIEEMQQGDLLVHLSDREDLVKYIDF